MRYLYLFLALLCYGQVFAQTYWGKITYPVYGSVMQGTTVNSNSIDVSFQIFNPSVDWRITLWQYDLIPGGTPTRYNVNGVPNYDMRPLNDPSLGFTFTPVANNSSYVYITGKLTNLPKKQYVLFLHRGNDVSSFSDYIALGVGDVYFIAGQSNAAGYNVFSKSTWVNKDNIDNRRGLHDGTNTDDLTIPFKPVHENKGDIMSRSLNFNGRFDFWASILESLGMPDLNEDQVQEINQKSREYNQLSPEKGNWFGLPYGHKYERLRNGTDKLNDPVHIYPNGQASWYWALLGQKIGWENAVPTLFFNVAVPGTSLIKHWTKDSYSSGDYPELQEKFLKTLALYGSAHGVKAILWHQGEEDAARASTEYSGTENVNLSAYSSRLNGLIHNSRDYIGDIGKDMAWYVSKASLFTSTNNSLTNSSGNSGISIAASVGNGRYSYTNSTLVTQQQSIFNSSNKVYAGFTDSDNIGGTIRDNKFKIHFSGDKNYSGSLNSLDKIANDWYSSIYANYSNYNGIAPANMIKLQTVSQSGNSITLTYEAGGSEYYFVRGQNGVFEGAIPGLLGSYKTFFNQAWDNSNRTYTFNNIDLNEGEFLSCYVKVGNRLIQGQPYYATPVGTISNAKQLEVANSLMNINSNSQQISNNVYSKNVTWQVGSKPDWVSNISSVSSFGEENLNITFDGNTGADRTGQIIIQEVGGGLSKTITINQSGTDLSGITSLLTLTPTNSSSEWTGYGSTRFDGKSIDGNTMQVSGVQYYQGIGTHADSRMVFNLSGGSYTTFYGKVGRDDDADNGSDLGKVQFSIKTDGSAVWNSGVHGNTTGAESFSINVTGKNTLELLLNQSGDGIYYDHANWMDVYLSGGSGTPCTHAAPTGVSASPSSHGAGGGSSTLSASCPTGTTVRWSHGLGNGSPKVTPVNTTTTYTAQCVSVDCTDSSPVAVTVTVGTGCGTLTNDLVVGYWTVTGHPLVAKQFHGTWWLVQKINNSPEQFLVRGSEMLTRGDVTLTNSSYPGLVGCFAYTYSDYGGLQPPSSVTFPTPSGYNIGYEPDGTPYYTASGSPPSGCTDAYLTNSWTYASAAGSTGSIPKIGLSFDGIDMTMGSVNYSASYPGTGIGTHATSEIIYDLGASHGYTHFKSVVGKDNEAVCGEDRLVFKVYNNATNALLGTSPVVGTPSYGLPQTSEMSVDITGVRYLKLVVEDGGDYIYCDHANWARARLTCSSSGRMAATDSVASFFTVYPNVSRGEFTVDVELQTDQEVSVSLISSSGAVYQQETYQGAKGRNALKFNAAKVISGLYHVRVSTRERVASKTVVIEK